MRFTELQRIFFETNLARDRAETLLRGLLHASRAMHIHNVVGSGPKMRCGQDLDQAISTTRQMVAVLDAAMDSATVDMNDDEMQILDESCLPDYQNDLEAPESISLEEMLRAEQIDEITEVTAQAGSSEHPSSPMRGRSTEPIRSARTVDNAEPIR